MAIKPFVSATEQRNQMVKRAVLMAVTAAIILPGIATAQGTAESNVCGVLSNLNGLLNVASVVVVTIAVIFSGYQIAFAHKRISDVAPVLIGGVLIGAAAQIAKMVIGGNGATGSTSCGGTSVNTAMLMDHLHSAVHLIQHYA